MTISLGRLPRGKLQRILRCAIFLQRSGIITPHEHAALRKRIASLIIDQTLNGIHQILPFQSKFLFVKGTVLNQRLHQKLTKQCCCLLYQRFAAKGESVIQHFGTQRNNLVASAFADISGKRSAIHCVKATVELGKILTAFAAFSHQKRQYGIMAHRLRG
ncbi:hypothetical protein SDC9_191473 [bioreactor metagenome]|uniref:Uncharacterized protein n=1 Tax=bioreactor metagenome TaxID=1076179 RepID=A0A645HZJ8_9ZZZZ